MAPKKLQTDVMTAESSPDTDEAPLKRRKVNQEKRRCPECAAQVGPRFGTGKKGDGSQCPGLSASGERCTYVFSGSRRKQIYQELFERCTSKAETNLADAKGAFERATRKVVTEAAKTGGSAVLLWFNAVVEGAGNSKELERILQRTSKLEAGQPVATPGEYAYRAKSAGTIHKCGVVLQASTQTEAADAILSQAAPAMHVTSLQTLQMAADQAAARLAAMNETLTGSGQGQVEVERGSQELADFLRDKGLYDACYTRLLREGLTLDVMKAIIAANRELQNFVESLKFAGLSAGHAMVIFAHLSKP